MALDDPEHVAALSARDGSQRRPDHSSRNKRITFRRAHRSARSTLPKPFNDDMSETLVAAVPSAPRSSTQQHWNVIVVPDPDLRSRLTVPTRGQSHIGAVPLILLLAGGLARTRPIGAERHAPTLGITASDSFMTARLDVALAPQIALIAPKSPGLGAVCIGARRNHLGDVAQLPTSRDAAAVVLGRVVGDVDPDGGACVGSPSAQTIVLSRDR